MIFHNSWQNILCHQLFSTVQLQVPEKYKKLLQRDAHGAATVTVNSDCVEVILFGGRDKKNSRMADTIILKFGEYFK